MLSFGQNLPALERAAIFANTHPVNVNTSPSLSLFSSVSADNMFEAESIPMQNDAAASIPKKDSSNIVPASEFTFAGERRYLLDGSPPLRTSDIKPLTTLYVCGTYLATLVALHVYQENTIWTAKSSFRIRDNFDESLSANYGGHMIAAYFISYVSEEALLASGVSTSLSPIYGALMGLAYQVYVEVLDGYGADYALSPYEMYSNITGAVYYLASHYSPFLQNFVPKFNYYPSTWFGDLPKAGSKTPIDDYSAWNFWICVNVPHLLSDNYSSIWPKWLDLDVGYSARNLGYPDRSRLVTFSLDYNLIELLPDGSPTWNWIKRTLNFFKFPSPTWEIWQTRHPQYYLLYPFHISIGNISF